MFDFSGFPRLSDHEAHLYEALQKARDGLDHAMSAEWGKALGNKRRVRRDLAKALGALQEALGGARADGLVGRWRMTREWWVDSWYDPRAIGLLDLRLHQPVEAEALRGFFGWPKGGATGKPVWGWCRGRVRDFLDAVLAAVKPEGYVPQPAGGGQKNPPDPKTEKPPRPTWRCRGKGWQLCLGDEVQYTYKRTAERQFRLLNAFEEAGWPEESISLPRGLNYVQAKNVKDALNRCLEKKSRFMRGRALPTYRGPWPRPPLFPRSPRRRWLYWRRLTQVLWLTCSSAPG
jgi:hypothetical protein